MYDGNFENHSFELVELLYSSQFQWVQARHIYDLIT